MPMSGVCERNANWKVIGFNLLEVIRFSFTEYACVTQAAIGKQNLQVYTA